MPSSAPLRRAITATGVAVFLAVHLANPLLQSPHLAPGWTRNECEQKHGRLPYLPRQSWSPSVNDSKESVLRKRGEPRPTGAAAGPLTLAAATPGSARLRPRTLPPTLDTLTCPAYLLPFVVGAPPSWRPPPA
jgi:hypothetical protein